MQSNAKRAKLCRDRADELRMLIAEWGDAFSRDALERIARDYDACADHLEQESTLLTAEVRLHLGN